MNLLPRSVPARVASVRFNFDERVEEGLYAAHALDDFRMLVEHPQEQLAR